MIILKVLWQLPQSILAFFVWLFVRGEKEIYEGKVYYRCNTPMGLSLGEFVFVYKYSEVTSPFTKEHERGHSTQSTILGPLYLLIVGLPSIVMNILTRLKVLKHENYYKRFPENWADGIRNIERN